MIGIEHHAQRGIFRHERQQIGEKSSVSADFSAAAS
jgi:hypothetical protein